MFKHLVLPLHGPRWEGPCTECADRSEQYWVADELSLMSLLLALTKAGKYWSLGSSWVQC